ncbi:hypothetical protein [Methanocalculus sp.]|uniref:hypothetical protein n=1 Tax=Methanocalculus sp. TaxID=2004547 RepID=UPI0026374D6B|nr:hypothetical protein [Methanocalculus sp.]MDG6250857.1 hypothetical protein [Methanocalculus sp.]
MSAFTVERTIRYRCRSYRISTSGDTVRDAIKSLDYEIAELRRSPCEEPEPVVLIDDIKRKERQTPAQLEPGVYRGICVNVDLKQPPARIDKTLQFVFQLIDASLNAINQFIKDSITIGRGDDEISKRRLTNLARSTGVSRLNDTSQILNRIVGIIVDHRGRVAAYQDVGVIR